MLLKTIKGMYQLQYNYHDSFNLEDFTSKYIEEFMDSYPYIVGDFSSGILRLKGFNNNPNSEAYYKNINKYLEVSCAFGCPFYILKRVNNEDEYNRLSDKAKEVLTEPLFVIPAIQKVNYDKESLELETSKKVKPRIVLDMARLTGVPRDEPFSDVKEFISQDKNASSPRDKKQKATPAENVTSYVSASPDFDPSKKAKFNNKGNQNNNQGKSNNQNNNQNSNKTNQSKPNNSNKNQTKQNNQGKQNNQNNSQNNQGKQNNQNNSQNNQGQNRNNQNRNNHKQKFNKGPKPNGEVVRKDQNNG